METRQTHTGDDAIRDDAIRNDAVGQAQPLHIVHVISGLDLGGAETVLHRLTTAPEQRDRHTVISMGEEGVFGPRLRAAGIPVHTLGMRGVGGAIKGAVRLHGLLRRLRPDVVQTWMYHADLVGGVVARMAGIRAVAWGIRNSGDNLQASSRSAKAISWVCARISGMVPGVIVACAHNAAARHRQWGYRADRMLVIPNGYDLARWRPDAQQRERIRAELGVSSQTPLMGSVARWNPLKDHANLLDAFALSLRTHPSLRCVLVGDQMSPDNTALMALIHQHGLDGKVILLGKRDDVPQLMNALDIHVLSSCAEGFPNVVAEAMASGAPCVVTDVGDAARIVGEQGWIAPPRNAQALSQAIDAAVSEIGSPDFSARKELGRQRVMDLFGMARMADAYHAVWKRLAQDYPGVPKPAAASTPRLLFVVNNPAFFLSHRLPLALGASRAGFDVHVATMTGPSVTTIVHHGFAHHALPMSRSGKNPIAELRTIYALWRLFRDLRPNIVHAVTIKPVLYGGIAARLAGVPAYVAAVSGLGYIFTRAPGKFDLLRATAIQLYRGALGHPNSKVIFQNANDADVLLASGVVRPDQVVRIRGSGVDLDEFHAAPEPDGPPVAIMASRLLVDKGVVEFAAAARMTADDPSGLRWLLAGSPDPGNPASITVAEWERWRQEGVIECLGERTDIAALYRQSHIVVLPSYREGLPKSLVEAAACGRAVVTTDVPGCRDAIEPGVTGLLAPPRDAGALAQAVLRLARDSDLRRDMGAAGRRLAESEFAIGRIVQAHLDLYQALSR